MSLSATMLQSYTNKVSSMIPNTYTGGTVAIASDGVSVLGATQPGSVVGTPFGNMAQSLSGGTDIIGAVTGILGTLGIGINASGSGVSVTQAPTAGQTLYDSNPKEWYEKPLVLLGIGAAVLYFVTRK